jgi:hypothetical protein
MPLINKERLYAVQALSCYWAGNEELILALPIATAEVTVSEPLPPSLRIVRLPDWADDISVGQGLLVPSQYVVSEEGPAWDRTDWLGVIFWYLNGLAERAFEKQNGPIHSYAFRLKGWDPRLWRYAWVNRIGLFLRRWAAQLQGVDEEALFGPLPTLEVILTHDVDAIEKTMAVRLKQVVVHIFNGLRQLSKGHCRRALGKFGKAIRFLLTNDNYWCFEIIRSLEEAYHQRSHFYIYGGRGGLRRGPRQLLMDPSYQAGSPRLKQELRKLHADGWIIGLHQSFDAWADNKLMAQEREYLEQVLDSPVTSCRQHWMRFSWEHTWRAQEEAGFALDVTLGFNDRPAFRNGAALRFRPWDFTLNQPMQLKAIPTVLMDSHFYDKSDLLDCQRQQQLNYWLDEIRFVGGTAAVLWHQRVMSKDYGWDKGFRHLLECL